MYTWMRPESGGFLPPAGLLLESTVPSTLGSAVVASRVPRLALLLAGLVFAGCGPGNPLGRQPVSGTVTLDGQPLALGAIRFDPMSGGAGAAATTVVGGEIRDGRYDLPADVGVPPGKYSVSITSTGAAPPLAPGADPMAAPPPASPELVPERYNRRTELSVDVTDAGPNEFPFALESKKQ